MIENIIKNLDLHSNCYRLITSSNLVHYSGLASLGYPFSPFALIAFNTLVVVATTQLSIKIYRVLFSPLRIVRDQGSVGYVKSGFSASSLSNRQLARRWLARKKIGQIPPVYPNGWFALIGSKEIARGEVKSVVAFGQQIAVFRSNRGVVRAVDAYCPHMGANMAVGGKVVGADCIECPFHGWKFSGKDGKLQDIPYSTTVPAFAAVKAWNCCEENGMVYVWHHCDDVEPQWMMSKCERLADMKFVGSSVHIVDCHIQDIPENAADVAHLTHLHRPVFGSDVEKTNNSLVNNLVHHNLEAHWTPSNTSEESHLATMSILDNVQLLIFRVKLHLIRLQFEVLQIGPGVVHIHVTTPFSQGTMVQSVTPIGPLKQKLTHHFYSSSWTPTFIAKALFALEATQVERDIMIWNNKTYLKRPKFCREEKSLVQHRRWYSQFYSDNSPVLSSCDDDVADW